MGYVYIKDLKPGMITAVDIYNLNDQLIISAQTTLTDSIISSLDAYSLQRINIVEKSNIPTYSDKVVYSPKFKEFKHNFTENTTTLHNSLSNIVDQQKPLNENLLLDQMNHLVPENTTSIGVFDMIHNMRQYDDSTYAHCINVSLICRVMADWLHFSQEDTDTLVLCGLVHDIGKLSIPDSIIKKPGSLTNEEFNTVKTHTLRGYEFLRNQDIDERIKNAALMHHERCDGSGYPNGLASHQIEDFAKLIAIADVYDAMTSSRVYRGAQCPFRVISLFEEEGLQKYDPHYILTFLERIVSSYMNNNVRLSDGRIGEVVLINNNRLSRPMVRVADEYIDLSKKPELYIREII